MSSRCVFYNRNPAKSVQRQRNSIYYTELHVSTYFKSSSSSQFVLKYIEERILSPKNVMKTIQMLKLLWS
jgi:hypothetical protein